MKSIGKCIPEIEQVFAEKVWILSFATYMLISKVIGIITSIVMFIEMNIMLWQSPDEYSGRF